MYSKVEISLPNPCDKDWNKMAQAKDGKFCSSCSMIVIDFTQMSNQEIAAYLLKNSANKTCGHFRKGQIKAKQNAFHHFLLSMCCTSHSSKQNIFKKLFLVIIGGMLTLTGCGEFGTGKMVANDTSDSLNIPSDSLTNTNQDSIMGKLDSVNVHKSE